MSGLKARVKRLEDRAGTTRHQERWASLVRALALSRFSHEEMRRIVVAEEEGRGDSPECRAAMKRVNDAVMRVVRDYPTETPALVEAVKAAQEARVAASERRYSEGHR